MGQTSSTATTADLPVMPDQRIRYESLPPRRPLTEYIVQATEPIHRDR